jgi:energy-coupling factor transport system ATP-binding protein
LILQEDLQLNHVSVKAPNNQSSILLLKDISLRISPGEWISIVGRNGSGKSTLAQLLIGVNTASSGSIKRGFCGNEPIPYVMQQEMQWFGETPWEDLVFLLESRGEIAELIPELVRTSLLSVGLESRMERPYSELSGGQKQLAAIAGCLAAKTPILVFDEATSMLDSMSRIQVLEAAKSINRQGTTVIWLTHHIEDLTYGERVIALEEGRICYDDSTSSFFYGLPPNEADLSIKTISPCEELGFVLPYPILLTKELSLNGVQLHSLPLTIKQFVEAVSGLVN